MVSEVILSMASLDRDQSRELVERLRRGEDVNRVIPESGIDKQNFIRKVQEVEWPTDEEIFEALAWE